MSKTYKIYDSDFSDVFVELTETEIREKLGKSIDVDIEIFGQCEEFGDSWITHYDFLKLEEAEQ